MSRTTVVRRDRVVTVTVIEQKPIVAVRPAKQVITVTSTRGPRGLDGADGPTSHPLLTDRDTVDSHPLSAITSLVSTLDGKVDVSGDTMTGPLILNADPAVALESVTKQFVDAHFSLTDNPHSVTAAQVAAVAISGDTMTGPLIIGVGAADVSITINQAATPTANIAEFNFFGGTGGNAFVVDAAGNMGIGITPNAALDVESISFPVLRGIRRTGLTNAVRGVQVLQHKTGSNMVDGFGTQLSFQIRDNSNVDNDIGGISVVRDGADNSGKILFDVFKAGVQNAGVLIVNSNGDVGINEQDPSAKLHITNALATDVGFNIELAAAQSANAMEINTTGVTGGDLVVVDAAGNMGIGAPSTGKLHVEGSVNPPIRCVRTSTQTSVGLNALQLIHKTTADAVDGFGPFFSFAFTDSGVTNAVLGRVGGFRDGSDTLGGLNFFGGNGGATEFARFNSAGNFLQGTTTSPTGTATKVHVYGDNAGDPTMGSNTAATFAKDVAGTVHMFAIGETGAATQLSSHDPDTEEWIHYSYNKRTGKKLRINLERFFHDKYPEYITEYQRGEK